MATAAEVGQVAASIPDIVGLQNLASGVLTICIAYLALPIFRYRNKIEGQAETILTELDNAGASTNTGCNSHYAELVKFAGTRATEKQRKHHDEHEKKIGNGHETMAGKWIFYPFFNTPFSWDMACVVIFAIIGVLTIAGGAAKQSNLIDLSQSGSFHFLSYLYLVICTFFLSLMGMILPLIFVWRGNRREGQAMQHINRCRVNCVEQLSAKETISQAPSSSPVDIARDIVTQSLGIQQESLVQEANEQRADENKPTRRMPIEKP